MSQRIAQTAIYGTLECVRFRRAIFNRHWRIDDVLALGFLKHDQPNKLDANRNGNTWLRRASASLLLGNTKASAVMDDQEIRELADTAARSVEKIIQRWGPKSTLEALASRVRARVEHYGVPWPTQKGERDPKGSGGAIGAHEAIAARATLVKAIAQTQDPRWWRAALRKAIGRQVETIIRSTGAIARNRAPYLSDWAFARWQAAQQRNRGTLANLIAISDEGDELPLQDCIDASVSNPVNRRHELMVRMRGWETVADALQLQGALLTLTCPSRYHACHVGGADNAKFDGSTPLDAMTYLNGVWARIRSEWQRNGIKAIGFRICEPHHDGTPHFHFLLFFAPAQWAKAWSTFQTHALAVDGDEPGALEHRCDYRLIDKAKGSATGYIAKYVAKNIDGYGFGDDETDNESQTQINDSAARVRAWASLWGIRQFQQIGSVSVTVYRELRRLTHPLTDDHPEQIEIARAAADCGDWAAFVDAMGGAFVRRNEQLLRPLKKLADTPGRYGDEILRILGLVMRAASVELHAFVLTRTKTWNIVPRWALENLRDRSLP